MQHTIIPGNIHGTLRAPSSKSVAQRAVAIAALAGGLSRIYHIGQSQDVLSALGICRQLGAVVREREGVLEITGGISAPEGPVDCGESGLAVRMFSSVAALLDREVVLTGHGSLLNRPMNIIEDALRAAGVNCSSNNGFLPVSVHGPLQGGKMILDGSVSSQVLTGLLIAGPYARQALEIHVSNLKSKSYIDLTIEVMKSFGVEVTNEDYQVFHVPAPIGYVAGDFVVEGDWSGAAFLLVAGAIAGEIAVTNLRKGSSQPDRAILEVLRQCGARVHSLEESVVVEKDRLDPFNFDATHCPDLFPPLVALAAHCQGVSAIAGVHRLRVKESDRAYALRQEFAKMGIDITLEGDIMVVKGGKVNPANVDSHNDHRIAMACAVAALPGQGPVSILKSEAVNKSFPGFFSQLNISH